MVDWGKTGIITCLAKRVVGELYSSLPSFNQNKSSDIQYTYRRIYRSDSQLLILTPSESHHTSGVDEVGSGLAASLTSHPVSERWEKLWPQSYLLSVGGLAQSWIGPVFPATSILTSLQILLLLQWAESKGELEVLKDSSGSLIPRLIHQPVASLPCQWSVLPHTDSYPNIIPVTLVPKLPKTTCHSSVPFLSS